MSDRERVHQIVDTLPPRQIEALLALLQYGPPISDREFAERLAGVSEEEIEQTTAARVLFADADHAGTIPHAELKRQLGL